MRSGDRLVAAGGVVAGLGGVVGAGYLIYSLQERVTFWSWIGIASVSVAAIGLIAVAVGLILPSATVGSPTQRQAGGRRSVNLQAGRDISIEKRPDESE